MEEKLFPPEKERSRQDEGYKGTPFIGISGQ